MITTYLEGIDAQRDNWYKVFNDAREKGGVEVHIGYIFVLGETRGGQYVGIKKGERKPFVTKKTWQEVKNAYKREFGEKVVEAEMTDTDIGKFVEVKPAVVPTAKKAVEQKKVRKTRKSKK